MTLKGFQYRGDDKQLKKGLEVIGEGDYETIGKGYRKTSHAV